MRIFFEKDLFSRNSFASKAEAADSAFHPMARSLFSPSFLRRAGGAFTLGAMLFAGNLTAQPTTGRWETFGNGPEHTGFYPATLGPNSFTDSWSRNFTVPINPVAVSGGRVFYTTNGYFTSGMQAGALDENTGETLWTYALANAYSINPPTHANGRVYFQRGNSYNDTHLWCLNATTGNLLWNAPHSAQWERYGAPTVAGNMVWVASGAYSGITGFDATTGAQKFFVSRPQKDQWTPTHADGVIYSWVNGSLEAADAATGTSLWSRTYDSDNQGHIVVVSGGKVIVATQYALRALSLASRRQSWTVTADFFSGTPAVDGTNVYALLGNTVTAYSLATGALVGVYPLPATPIGQPIVTNDRLLVATSNATYVFDRTSQALMQTLPAGGSLSYAAGRLFVASEFNVAQAGRLATFTIALNQPEGEGTPTPTPTPSPTPTPTPSPSPTPSPTATPVPSPTTSPSPTPSPTPLPTPPPASTSAWLDAQAHGDLAYFLFASPARLERYRLSTGEWLAPLSLTGATPSAFTVDANGLYIASGAAIARYALDGSARTDLLVSGFSVGTLRTRNGILYLFDPNGSKSAWVNKETGQSLGAKNFDYALTGFSFAAQRNAFFGRSTGISPSDILKIAMDAGGNLTAQTDSPYHGSFASANQTFVSIFSDLVAENTGLVYQAGNLTYSGSLGGNLTDLVFTSDGGGLLLRPGYLASFNDRYLEKGRVTVPGPARRLFLTEDAAVVFFPADTRGVWALRVPLTYLSPAVTPPGVNPDGLAYTPDALAYGGGIVYLLSKSERTLFRWSVAERRYLSSLGFETPPTHLAYSAANQSVYLGYETGRITSVYAPYFGAESPVVNLPQAVKGLTAVGPMLFACDPSGPWATHYVFDAKGTLLGRKDWNETSPEFVWSEENRTIYFFRSGSPRDLLGESIEVSGSLGNKTETPYHDSFGFESPIRVSPDGSRVLLGSGRIFETTSLTLYDTLETKLTDAAWLGAKVLTISPQPGDAPGTTVQTWGANTFAPLPASTNLPGAPLRLWSVDSEAAVVVTLPEGVPAFTVLDADLQVVTSGPSPTPTPTATPTPTPTATPSPSPTATPSPSASPKPSATPTPARPAIRVRAETDPAKGIMLFTLTNAGGKVDNFRLNIVTHLTPLERGRSARLPAVTYTFRDARVTKASLKATTGLLPPGQSIQLRMQLDGLTPATRASLVSSLLVVTSANDPAVIRLTQAQMAIKFNAGARR